MNLEKKIDSKLSYTPIFHYSYLHPKYWIIWIAFIFLIIIVIYFPIKMRDCILSKAGKFIGKLTKKSRKRAEINLLYCFPKLSKKQRDRYIDEMFSVAAQSIGMLSELFFYDVNEVLKRTKWHNVKVIQVLKKEKRNVIFMAPHVWAVDIPAILLAAQGQKMAALFHHQKNLVVDFLWNKVRCNFGGRLHARNSGIRAFISSIRNGYWGVYLPDQDYGEKHSEFVNFFGTYKATLSAIGTLMKVCNAEIVPLLPVYNDKKHQLDIYIHNSMNGDFENKIRNKNYIAQRTNKKFELLIHPYLEQYVWVLKFLKTRKKGELSPYR